MHKRSSSFIVAILVFSMIAIYGFIPMVEAASLTQVKDTLSTSVPSATGVTHTIGFTTGVVLNSTDKIDVVIPAAFGNVQVGNVTCPHPASTTATVTGTGPWTVSCEVKNFDSLPAEAMTLSITNVTNPATVGDYTINVGTKTTADVDIEKAQAKVYILNAIAMNASVDASLSFSVSGLAKDTVVNGAVMATTTSAATTSFGTLPLNASSTVGQQLAVQTNATAGFVVTVQETQELTSAGSAKINSFRDSPIGTGSTTAAVWAAPANSLGAPDTYGHMGVTTSDTSLSTGDVFGGAKYKGFTGTTGIEVMYHNGPANGTTDTIGLTNVAYTIQIGALQEAGDYSTSLIYVCTPTF